MRTSILAMIVVAGSVIAFPAMAQQQQAAPSEQTRDQIQRDADKANKTTEPSEQMQRDADKGIKTRNSGESGYVADQDKSGAAAHPPGRPENDQTTGSTSPKK
jgi:Ni/Co efflux regulator RcnB